MWCGVVVRKEEGKNGVVPTPPSEDASGPTAVRRGFFPPSGRFAPLWVVPGMVGRASKSASRMVKPRPMSAPTSNPRAEPETDHTRRQTRTAHGESHECSALCKPHTPVNSLFKRNPRPGTTTADPRFSSTVVVHDTTLWSLSIMLASHTQAHHRVRHPVNHHHQKKAAALTRCDVRPHPATHLK